MLGLIPVAMKRKKRDKLFYLGIITILLIDALLYKALMIQLVVLMIALSVTLVKYSGVIRRERFLLLFSLTFVLVLSITIFWPVSGVNWFLLAIAVGAAGSLVVAKKRLKEKKELGVVLLLLVSALCQVFALHGVFHDWELLRAAQMLR